MAKNELTLQQKRRQAARHAQTVEAEKHTATVVTRFAKEALIASDAAHIFRASIRQSAPNLVAGDEVIFDPNNLVIEARLPRKNVLARVSRFGKTKTLAANVTQLVIVMAVEPQTPFLQIDSYLVLAKKLGLKVCLIINKIDLLKPENKTTRYDLYENLGCKILRLHKNLSDLNTILTQNLEGEVSVFVGQSGVGKSSLINSILGRESALVGHLSNNLGRHTTSNAHYYFLENGALIDSPGVREFQLDQFTEKDLFNGFEEARNYYHQCRFKNCRHQGEEGCFLAEIAHTMAPSRLESFRALFQRTMTHE